jgi:hypothetical protein
MSEFPTKVIDTDNYGKPVKITVRRVSTRLDTRRYLLSTQGEKQNIESPDEELNHIRLILFPTLATATVSAEGIPFPFTAEDVAEFDGGMTTTWLDGIYEVNPQWKAPGDPDPKKESASKKG